MANNSSHALEASATMLPPTDRLDREVDIELTIDTTPALDASDYEEPNKVRSFSIYEVLHKPLLEFLQDGDGVNSLPVYNDEDHPNAKLIDSSLIDAVKFISTAFGRVEFKRAHEIERRIAQDRRTKKKTLRFRSKHPLYCGMTNQVQNTCLISGMVHLHIPILPYFDGEVIINENKDPDDLFNEVIRRRESDLG